jgi:hypothetical protein
MARITHRLLVGGSVFALFGFVTTGCPGSDTKRNLSDSTAPTLTLTVTAAKSTASGLLDVPFGTNAELKVPGGTILVKADDPDGVAWVELWMSTTKSCPGVITGPGLAGAPEKRVEGAVTSTSAPTSLTAGYDINTHPLVAGCTYTWDVWGKAANAATTAVEAQSPHSSLTLKA